MKKTIANEIQDWITRTGKKQVELAQLSGVPASTICNLLRGKRKNVLGSTQDALRNAMNISCPSPVKDA